MHVSSCSYRSCHLATVYSSFSSPSARPSVFFQIFCMSFNSNTSSRSSARLIPLRSQSIPDSSVMLSLLCTFREMRLQAKAAFGSREVRLRLEKGMARGSAIGL
jgi:hypothetical protein